jgi:hypothetical protein
MINIQLSGNTKVRIIDRKQDNQYKRAKPGEKKVRVQDDVYHYIKMQSQTEVTTVKNKITVNS